MLCAMLVRETQTHFCRGGGFEKLRNRSNHTQKVDPIRADLGHRTLPTSFLPTILVWFWLSRAYKSPLLQKKENYGANLPCMLLLCQLDIAGGCRRSPKASSGLAVLCPVRGGGGSRCTRDACASGWAAGWLTLWQGSAMWDHEAQTTNTSGFVHRCLSLRAPSSSNYLRVTDLDLAKGKF